MPNIFWINMDLIKLGFKPGRDLGNMLNYMFDIVVENPKLNTNEYLEYIATTMLKDGRM